MEDIQPTSVRCYIDKIHVRLKKPISRTAELKLRRLCGSLYVDNRYFRFGPAYRQRLDFTRPNEEALRWIAARKGAVVYRVELSLDFIFATAAECDHAFLFFHRHFVRPWHGKTQRIFAFRGEWGEPATPSRDDISRANTRGRRERGRSEVPRGRARDCAVRDAGKPIATLRTFPLLKVC